MARVPNSDANIAWVDFVSPAANPFEAPHEVSCEVMRSLNVGSWHRLVMLTPGLTQATPALQWDAMLISFGDGSTGATGRTKHRLTGLMTRLTDLLFNTVPDRGQ